jgi:iron complex outermembrane recepter protein
MTTAFAHFTRPPTSVLALSALAVAAQLALLGSAVAQTAAPAADSASQVISITGTRIKSLALTATSPVSQISAEQLQLSRSVTVEDFSTKLPQLAGGVNSTSAGSDAFGAQTLDLRNLGQSRTLVLINGTRAVPFSLRNAVDVNFIPAPLIKRVDVLTGGAAAVYGADAISGVVNFIMNDSFEGVLAQANYRSGDGGGAQYGANLTGGIKLGNSGNLVGYVEFTQRDKLLAAERPWALDRPALLAGNGGNFTDVASGTKFSVDNAGNYSTTARQTQSYVPQYTLVMPLKRTNASVFGKFAINDAVELYGRVMLSKVETEGAPRSGQAPTVINANYLIDQTNPFIPTQARSQLTFVGGKANVTIERSLGELGVKTATNDRTTSQLQVGARGDITPSLAWDLYAQTGKSKESIVVDGDGVKARFTDAYVNSVDIFGPGANLSGLAQQFKYGDRERKQDVAALTLSGNSSGLFSLPAGPMGFAVGAETRKETGKFDYNPNLGQSFNQGVESAPPVPPFFKAKEFYAELKVPLLAKLPFVQSLDVEGAFRKSSYDKSVGASNSYNTDKLGLSWVMNDVLRLRATQQNVLREPNFGEFANPIFSIPFANLRLVARLNPRYQGDPCVSVNGAPPTGNAAQCARLAPGLAPYDSLNAANLTGGYFFGGNPDIRAEKGKTSTFGLVLTPLAGLSVTADFYKISITDAVGQIQPVDALTSCFITDPSAGNPLCAAVTRDPVTQRIKDGFPVDRNLALIEQEGVDIDVSWRLRNAFGMAGHALTLQGQWALVTKYNIQKNPLLAGVDCKASYGARCSSDAVSLVAPDYRHRVAATWGYSAYTAQLGWKRIGKVKDSTVNSTDVIKAQDTFELNLSMKVPNTGLTVNAGVDNLFDKKPPTPTNAGSFNTYPDTYNIVGRTFGLAVSYKF